MNVFYCNIVPEIIENCVRNINIDICLSICVPKISGTWEQIMIAPFWQQITEWAPFVFAHEYYHNVLGHYWYCIKEGKETKGNYLEAMINEGQAFNESRFS